MPRIVSTRSLITLSAPRSYRIVLIEFLILLGLSSNLRADNTGEIQGIVPLPRSKASTAPAKKYFGKISGKVTRAPSPIAGVWLESASLSAPQIPPPITLKQANYQFSNFLIVVPTGTVISFPNEDPDYHNIYSLSKPSSFDLGRYKASEEPPPFVCFEKPGFVALHCEIHDHMKANIIVVDSPYYTVTDSTGAFSLKNIPPGEYTFHAQVSRKSSWKLLVRARSNQITQIVIPRK